MQLAINGGTAIRKKPFPIYNTIDDREKQAVAKVLDSGVLSKFLGCWDKDFYGGPQVRALEEEWAKYFGVKHAVAVNSCTSGLYCAVGAVGLEPGDEVIVSPYTMTASATAPLIFNAVPVFADIEQDYFCLDPISVEARITPRTRAILVVDIFGLPYDTNAINSIAEKYNLYVIEDTAQAPGARYNNLFAGTLGNIGVYSLNYHKHIHCGEGGIIVTNDDELAERVRLIRNHAEAVVEDKGVENLVNMVGFNFRMTEIEATIARCQLGKSKKLLEKRQSNSEYLTKQLRKIPALIPPKVRPNCTHAYYSYAVKFLADQAGVSRDVFINAVKAELIPAKYRTNSSVDMGCGYVKPLYLQPIFQKQICYGSTGCPFVKPWYQGQTNYQKGICPVAERMHYEEVFTHNLMHACLAREDLNDVVRAFQKVWENCSQLR